MISIVPITAQNVSVFKAVRLRALQESPFAFGSTFAREAQFTDEEWVRRTENLNGEKGAGFLAMDGDIVAKRLDRLARKGVVQTFRFLQAHDVGRPLLKPDNEAIHTLLDRVDVPGRDAHGVNSSVNRCIAACRRAHRNGRPAPFRAIKFA